MSAIRFCLFTCALMLVAIARHERAISHSFEMFVVICLCLIEAFDYIGEKRKPRR